MRPLLLPLLLLGLAAAPAAAQEAADFRDDALAVERLVNAQYAYLERLPGRRFPESAVLQAEAEAVHDGRSLLAYAERAVAALADHHAITGSSFADSWALVPSYADLWIEPEGEMWRITAVREGSPAEAAGVRTGEELVAIGGVATGEAVAGFWADLGLEVTPERASYAARVLAAGRRDRARDLTVRDRDGVDRRLTLPSLYALPRAERPPVTVAVEGEALVLRLNDSLGDRATITAFDEAIARARPGQTVVLDLRDTPSGGNTVVARAIMGWFVDAPAGYQIHRLPAEERETGVPRQWVEQVLPRAEGRHRGPVVVRVGRWTGSMGEGLAVGLDALGARVDGGPMAGLLGAVYDHRLPNSGLVLKLPTERLYAVDGTPREAFRPRH